MLCVKGWFIISISVIVYLSIREKIVLFLEFVIVDYVRMELFVMNFII